MTINELEHVLKCAHAHAQAREQQLRVEHALMALTEIESLGKFWRDFNVDVQALNSQLDARLHEQSVAATEQPLVSVDFDRFLHRASARASLKGGSPRISATDLFAALLDEESPVKTLLQQRGITLVDFMDYFDTNT